MAKNLFLAFSPTSVLIANWVAQLDTLGGGAQGGDTHVLVIEKPEHASGSVFVPPPREFYDMVECISSCYAWDRKEYLRVEHQYLDFLKQPLATARFARHLHQARRELERRVGDLSSFDRIYFAGNTFLWRAFGDLKADLRQFEHGASDYLIDSPYDPHAALRVKDRAKHLFGRALGYRFDKPEHRRVFVDGGRSALNRGRAQPVQGWIREFISRDPRPVAPQTFEKLFKVLSERLPETVAELEAIKKSVGDRPLAIYLPTVEVEKGKYAEYLTKQLALLEASDRANLLVLIKNHPTDYTDYRQHFVREGIDAFELKDRHAKFVSAEALMWYFGSPFVFGSYSTSIVYAKWWLGRKALFLPVPGHPVEAMNAGQYASIASDMANEAGVGA